MAEREGAALWDQIASVPALLRDEVWPMEGRLRLVLSTPEIYATTRIVICGSGDSHAAAVATAGLVASLTGVPTQALSAMDAARYLPAALGARPDQILVLAISQSGEAARVVEAARQLTQRGARVLAVTAHPESRLGKASSRSADITIAPGRPAPGVRSYVASMLGVLLLAIRFAEVRMRITMDEAQARRASLVALADAVETAVERSRSVLPALAAGWARFQAADALGSGAEAGTAAFAAAKLLEATGIHAAHQDVEEFHHLNYFVARPRETPAIVFWPAGSPAASRLSELVRTLSDLGRPSLVVTGGSVSPPGSVTLALPAVPDGLAPLLHTVPAAGLAAAWADAAGTAAFRGFEGPWTGARGSAIARNSFMLD